MSEQSGDLFGYTPPQGDLFAKEPARNNGIGVANPALVRKRLHILLAEARAAQVKPPWDERNMRANKILFPQMANWLPHEEAEQLRKEFKEEMRRLDQEHTPQP